MSNRNSTATHCLTSHHTRREIRRNQQWILVRRPAAATSALRQDADLLIDVSVFDWTVLAASTRPGLASAAIDALIDPYSGTILWFRRRRVPHRQILDLH